MEVLERFKVCMSSAAYIQHLKGLVTESLFALQNIFPELLQKKHFILMDKMLVCRQTQFLCKKVR